MSVNGPGCEARCQQGLRDPTCEMGVMITIATSPVKGSPCSPFPAVLLVCSLRTLCKLRLDRLRQEDSLPPKTRWERERLWGTGRGDPATFAGCCCCAPGLGGLSTLQACPNPNPIKYSLSHHLINNGRALGPCEVKSLPGSQTVKPGRDRP